MPPFAVLHVCMGNICRSPMAERLLVARAREALGERADEVDGMLLSHSTGTGDWHAGEPMNQPAARQLRARGAGHAGFAARQLTAAHIESSDLVLTATRQQVSYVGSLRPDATDRTFVLGEFGRLLRESADDLATLPPFVAASEAVHARGVALVSLIRRRRADSEPVPGDDLDDPWGLDEQVFARIADEIDVTVRLLADVLLRAECGMEARTLMGRRR